MELNELFKKNEPYAIEMRREFHMYPELSLKEERTSRRICEELEKMGISFEVYGHRNVIGVINKGKEGRKIAIRADIDALPVTEEVDLPFKSQNPGVMHACGHDAHMAILLGISKTLNEIKDTLNGTVYLCFQVAEEIGGGGSGECVEYLKKQGGVDQVIGTHIAGPAPVGTILLPNGPMMSGATGFKIKIKGVGGHGSRPDLAVDPLKPACDILLKIAAIPVNRYSPFDTVVVSPCMINGGNKANIIPDSAEIEGSIRYFKSGADKEVMEIIQSISEKTAGLYGAKAEVESVAMSPYPVINDDDAATRGRDLAKRLGLYVIEQKNPEMGSDDYAEFLDSFPGFYCLTGAQSKLPDVSGNHHNPKFCIDEGCIITGMTFLGTYAAEYLQ